VFAAFDDGSNEGQVAERIFINQGRQLLFWTGLNEVQLDKDFRQSISPRALIPLDASGNIFLHVSRVRGAVGPMLHLSSPAFTVFGTAYVYSRDRRAAPVPGSNHAAPYHTVLLRRRGRRKFASPERSTPLGVPELHNIWVASAETALANPIEAPNDAEELRTDEMQNAGG